MLLIQTVFKEEIHGNKVLGTAIRSLCLFDCLPERQQEHRRMHPIGVWRMERGHRGHFFKGTCPKSHSIDND